MSPITGVNSQSQLAVALSGLKVFDKHDIRLEQFATPGSIAAKLLWTAYMSADIKGKCVADYGAGTGILGIGAFMLGASVTLLVEKDEDAVAIARENLESVKDEASGSIEIISSDISLFKEGSDTVVMNPPFGAVRRNADRIFLTKAFENSGCVYSIHNGNSERFLEALARDYQFSFEIIGRESFPIKNIFRHHRKPKENVNVILCRFRKLN